VREAALLLIEDDERFRAGVRKGIEQADQGMFIDEAEMDARVSRMLSH
jgi:predicted transcriptional regulator